MNENCEFLPLYRDLMFKKFLGTNDYVFLTTYLLESLFNLTPGSLDGSTITNSVTLDKETIKNKAFELDVVLKTPDGVIYDIEMQNTYNSNSEVKNVMYVAKLFANELSSGDTYDLVKPVKLINLVKNLTIHKTGEIINKYVMTNTKYPEDRILEDYFSIYIVSLDTDKGISYNEDNEFEIIRRFIGAETYEDMEDIINKSNRKLSTKLLEEMVSFMNNKEVQDYSREEKLIETNLKTAKEEGRYEGILEGATNKQLEIAKKMLQANKSLEEISLFTGLSIRELEELKKEDL